MQHQSSLNQHADAHVYEIYGYKKCQESNLSPWQKISCDQRVLDAQAKAYELFKTKTYEKIEIQQKPINGNCCDAKVVKTYKKGSIGGFITRLIGWA